MQQGLHYVNCTYILITNTWWYVIMCMQTPSPVLWQLPRAVNCLVSTRHSQDIPQPGHEPAFFISAFWTIQKLLWTLLSTRANNQAPTKPIRKPMKTKSKRTLLLRNTDKAEVRAWNWSYMKRQNQRQSPRSSQRLRSENKKTANPWRFSKGTAFTARCESGFGDWAFTNVVERRSNDLGSV